MSSSAPTKYWEDAYRTRCRSIPDVYAYHNEAVAVMKTWEDEARFLADLAVRARVNRNRHCRAVALPTELLLLIFEYAKRLWFSYGSSKGYHRTWLAITQVCSRWRSVALDYAPLWSAITLSMCEPPTEMMAERSRTLPLHVSCNLMWSRCISNLEVFMGRIKTLNLRGDFEYRIGFAQDAFAPNLESLSLLANRSRDSEPTCIPSTFVAKHSHTLRHVALERFPFPWSTVFTRIETLSLYRSHATLSSPAHTPNAFEEILSGLANMPHLKYLSLKDVLPTLLPSLATEKVPLPNLHKLSLVGTGSSCVVMWKLLTIPSDISISVVCKGLKDRNHTLAQIYKWFSLPRAPHFKHLRITVRRYYMIAHFTMDRRDGYATVDDGIFDCDRHSSPELFLCFPLSETTDEVTYDFSIAATVFPLETFCIIGDEITWRPEQFDDFLARTRNLKRLEYITMAGYTQFLIKALGGGGDEDGRVVCPTLETVCMGGYIVHHSPFSQELADALKVRERGGFGLQTLQLTDYGPADDTIALLKTFVRDVEFLEGTDMSKTRYSESDINRIDWGDRDW